MVETILLTLVLFAEPGFPTSGVSPELPRVSGATIARSVAELEEALATPDRVLVWRHGSTFPAEAWSTLVAFLESGGSLVYLGGEPFTRPVTGAPGSRVVGPRTVSLLKELRLNQSYIVDCGLARHEYLPSASPTPSATELPGGTFASVLEPRFSDTRDFDHEDGTPGSRDAVLRPLSFVTRVDDSGFPRATGSFVIDRLRGRFAGGRWVFRLLSTAPSSDELDFLLREARRPWLHLAVDPTFGCFRSGEQPSVVVRVYRPRAEDQVRIPVSLTMQRSDAPGQWSEPRKVAAKTLECVEHARARLALPGVEQPGLYRVRLQVPGEDDVETGFWVFDPELFRSGSKLTFDSYTLRRDGVPEPVLGTTVMSETVHRKFLFEPNAAVWDDTFGELSEIGFNMVRTGIWSAYRKISLDPHVIDEAWLRALEAYYLTARRHGIAVVFTFFAFVPDSFGGDNPYFDPRSREAQRAYLNTVAARFKDTRELIWDLINEPSFSSPDHLWLCRPHGDAHETKAFREWLEQRFSGDEMSWEDRVRARWRLRPDEAIGLPTLDDFAERQVFESHRPYRARDYVWFAQEAFADWVRDMSGAIRNAGSAAAITVGQDEGGLVQRPSPLYHHDDVDFTSIHTWWFNDALMWDGLMAKAPRTPLLASETGIMQRELLSGEALRGPWEFAQLLSRKLGYAFAAGAFGMIQWCYEVNPYMASDNEVAIGLKRVDGSFKPEHRVMREFAAFLQRNRQRFDSLREPDVVLLMPSSDHFPPRGLQLASTKRAIEILSEELGVSVQIAPEHRVQDLGSPKLVIVPACRGISDQAWKRVIAGPWGVLCSGWFETDDAGLSARRLDVVSRELARVVSTPDGVLHYPLEITESWRTVHRSKSIQREAWFEHFPAPLEWARPSPVQTQVYRRALEQSGVKVHPTPHPGLLLRRLQFRDATLVVAVNASGAFVRLPVSELLPKPEASESQGAKVLIPAGECRMYFLDAQGQLLDQSHP